MGVMTLISDGSSLVMNLLLLIDMRSILNSQRTVTEHGQASSLRSVACMSL